MAKYLIPSYEASLRRKAEFLKESLAALESAKARYRKAPSAMTLGNLKFQASRVTRDRAYLNKARKELSVLREHCAPLQMGPAIVHRRAEAVSDSVVIRAFLLFAVLFAAAFAGLTCVAALAWAAFDFPGGYGYIAAAVGAFGFAAYSAADAVESEMTL